MDSLYEMRDRLQEVYAEHSRIFDKALQFIVALAAFLLISQNMGFMEAAASPVIAIVLAVICTFFPWNVTVIMAGLIMLVHMYALSLGVLLVTALVFLVMFIFYIRLTPRMAVVLLLTPLAFMLKIPFVVPIACALMTGPICMVAIGCGTIIYFIIEYVKDAAASLSAGGTAELMDQVTGFVQQIFMNTEMWIYVIAFMLCVLVVYSIRRASINRAWTIASCVGAVINIVVIAVGDVALGISTSYVSLILGNALAVVVGLVLEVLFFSVDYAHSESLQYEDDEYYYYVKAVPKLSVSTGDKRVQRINERQDDETEIIDTDEVRRRTSGGSHRRSSRAQDKQEAMEEVDRELVRRNLRGSMNDDDTQQ